MIAAICGSALVALAIGWCLGMWTRRRSDQWCPVDGANLTCTRCITAGVHSLAGPANLARRGFSASGGDAMKNGTGS